MIWRFRSLQSEGREEKQVGRKVKMTSGKEMKLEVSCVRKDMRIKI